MVTEFARDLVAKRIAGDIVWSNDYGRSLTKWREIFGVSKVEIAKLMGVSSSVITDYEKGRRTPGARFIKKYVEALLRYDEVRGWRIVKSLMKSFNVNIEAILDVREFEYPIPIDVVISSVKGILLNSSLSRQYLYGYTIVDSISAIQNLSGNEFLQIMGSTSERALIFTKVSTGRSPMIAVRVAPIKPAAVVLHGTRRVDPLAVTLAEKEGIPLILSLSPSLEDLSSSLKNLIDLFTLTGKLDNA